MWTRQGDAMHMSKGFGGALIAGSVVALVLAPGCGGAFANASVAWHALHFAANSVAPAAAVPPASAMPELAPAAPPLDALPLPPCLANHASKSFCESM